MLQEQPNYTLEYRTRQGSQKMKNIWPRNTLKMLQFSMTRDVEPLSGDMESTVRMILKTQMMKNTSMDVGEGNT